MWSFQIKFHKIISFRIISKITVNRKKCLAYDKTPPQILSLQFSEIFLDGGFQSFLTILQVTDIASIGITLMSLLQSLDTFLYTWRVRRSRPVEIFKKGVLKNSTKFTRKHLRLDLLCSKALLEACNIIKYRIW